MTVDLTCRPRCAECGARQPWNRMLMILTVDSTVDRGPVADLGDLLSARMTPACLDQTACRNRTRANQEATT